MIADYVSYEMIAITMFATMLLMLLTGQEYLELLVLLQQLQHYYFGVMAQLKCLIQHRGNYSSGTQCLLYLYLFIWVI